MFKRTVRSKRLNDGIPSIVNFVVDVEDEKMASPRFVIVGLH